ncbi:lytic transglycosylase domain-containing protein [Xanthomonas prunicola]|uniref:Lytic transglycosylase domain-containing protein n=1 Tax=Xanthomonas prunicola TaxID=2053930 RepID=A0A9Q9MUG2_9XANT|nr:lytic transglycosylase domain-containing protein [Xanthomonas prunicola]USJ02919.1 lytic transglycosylase domain-containing protein [Xanthomonas prunicola]UXA51244.1 lytic transglycosylase domain-containing protein [Xanthomonas prunicola]UXA59482.1 lytic transglycosylase domain-containing protein [Xanthomonas prunicola]UXA63428.1 lytic transglycosylase domain-containing protein [Xanthomonas prunicola]UXA67679.1 lytic transglycosylase domain-containing protein [Xanthomonas prunicola]
MELMGCTGLAVPGEVMQHVVRVESSRNPYAIGVVGGRLAREPRGLEEAVATAKMLEQRGYNFSLGLGQVNRYNLQKYGLTSYEMAFAKCPNLVAASKILAECHSRSGANWGKSFSCYYSGNFETGFKHGYVQKIYASIRESVGSSGVEPIAVIPNRTIKIRAEKPLQQAVTELADAVVARRIRDIANPVQTQASQQGPMITSPMPIGQGPSASPTPPADDVLYVVKAAGQGRGVAVPAGVRQASTATNQAPASVAPAQPPPKNQQVDTAFVF